jgi:deoxyribodipyrimidine photo-lyase
MSTGLYLFRKDLRLADNPLLSLACSECTSLILLVIMDPTHWADPQLGHSRMSFRRQRFVLEAIQDLALSIEQLGGKLTVRIGTSLEVLSELVAKNDVQRIYLEELPGTQEEDEKRTIEVFCADKNIQCISRWQRTLIRIEDLPMHWSKLPRVFTAFRIAVEKTWKIWPLVDISKWPTILHQESDPFPIHLEQNVPFDRRASMNFIGGSKAGKERIGYYCSDPLLLGQYKETRNGLVGADYSSKLSPWLAWGCISSNEILASVLIYESKFGANSSSYWLKFELLWRDFFQFTAKLYGTRIFMRSGFGETRRVGWAHNERDFEKWCAGSTGQEFIDACMRELVASGFMSNRGRQNAASYLVHDLMVDWRLGARFFEYHLLDYDVASNWCNWAYIAGVGNDPRAGRKFNIDKQATDYDSEHTFRNLWKQ